MRRQALVLVGASAAVSVALAIAVNIATNSLPRWIANLHAWTWALVVALGMAAVALAVWQRRLEGPVAVPGSHGAGEDRPHELPRDVRTFTGRDSELERLYRAARTAGIVTIAGKPGVGKSALAVHAAHALSPRYPDGHVYIDLKGLTGGPLNVQSVMLHVVKAFGGSGDADDSDERLAARYRSLLASRQAVLVLDDAENAAGVRPLLPPDGRCLMLITSRRPLTTLTEAPPPIVLEILTEDEALAMLRSISGGSRIDAEPAAAAELVRQCGSLPLALRIAAARLRRRPHWTVSDLVGRLRDERRRLDELHVDDLEVRACIALSYTDLAPEQAATFRWLSVIPGRDFSPEIAGAAADLPPETCQRVLDDLADVQLVEQQNAHRYRFHDLIRLFARERGEDEESSAERGAALRRVLTRHGVQLDVAAEKMNVASSVDARALNSGSVRDAAVEVPFSAEESEAARWLQMERGNLLAALFTASQFDDGSAWWLARSMLIFLENRSSLGELGAVLAVAERSAQRLGGSDHIMAARYFRGRVERLSGRPKAAAADLRASAQYFSGHGRHGEASEIYLALGQVSRENGWLDEAANALATAFRLRVGNDDQPGAAGVLIEAAVLLKEYNQLDAAARVLESAVALLGPDSGLGHSQVRLAWAQENLGAILKRLGRTNEAILQHEASLAAFTDLGHVRGQAYATRNLGDLALVRGDLPEANRRYTRSLRLFRAVGDRRGEAQSLAHLALIAFRSGHWWHASRTLVQAVIAARRAHGAWLILRQLRRSSQQRGQATAGPTNAAALIQLVELVDRQPS